MPYEHPSIEPPDIPSIDALRPLGLDGAVRLAAEENDHEFSPAERTSLRGRKGLDGAMADADDAITNFLDGRITKADASIRVRVAAASALVAASALETIGELIDPAPPPP